MYDQYQAAVPPVVRAPITIFEIVSLLITLTALFSYLNYRFIKLPTTIGVVLITLAGSLVLAGLQHAGLPIGTKTAEVLRRVDFDSTLLQGRLRFLLFAGGLPINLHDLAEEKWNIGVPSTADVLPSTFIFGNHGRQYAMSETTCAHLDMFCELVDEIFNAVLSVLLGFEVLVLTFSHALLLAGLLATPALLLARWVSVGLPVWILSRWQKFSRGTVVRELDHASAALLPAHSRPCPP